MIDATGCDPARLRERGALARVCDRVIDELGLRVVGTGQWHQFPGPGGWTAMFLLTESHLTLHTYPEFGTATFNLYCCREREPWPWDERLAEMLGAADVRVTSACRGEPIPANCEAAS